MANSIKSLINKMLAASNLRKLSKAATLGRNIAVSRKTRINSPDPKQVIIGDNCELACSLICQGDGRIVIGRNSWIGARTVIGSIDEITIGDFAIISTDVHIYDNNNHPTSMKKRREMSESGDFYGDMWKWTHADKAKVHIGDCVWIGERSTILKSVTIGDGSIVAAGSVVTHDVPPMTIVAGNPARPVKHLEE